MLWDPEIELGTVKVAENPPDASVVADVTVELSNVMLTLADEAKLVPVIVTDRPTIPDAGFRLINGICTVNEADPEWLPVATVPVIVTVKVPPGV